MNEQIFTNIHYPLKNCMHETNRVNAASVGDKKIRLLKNNTIGRRSNKIEDPFVGLWFLYRSYLLQYNIYYNK